MGGYPLTVSGKHIVNNGTITITGGRCFWSAPTEGTGKLVINSESTTYVDYGCVASTVTLSGNYKINITADPAVKPTVTLPNNMQAGQQISPTVSGLIEGVPIAEAFTFTWRNASSATIYDGAASPVLTDAGTLKLLLSPKSPYVMRSSHRHDRLY